jgi:hypothetical protein
VSPESKAPITQNKGYKKKKEGRIKKRTHGNTIGKARKKGRNLIQESHSVQAVVM